MHVFLPKLSENSMFTADFDYYINSRYTITVTIEIRYLLAISTFTSCTTSSSYIISFFSHYSILHLHKNFTFTACSTYVLFRKDAATIAISKGGTLI